MAQYVAAVRLHRVVEIHRGGTDHIVQIKVQEPNGTVTIWDVADAVQSMVSGTDAFFVCASDGAWSPLTPWPYRHSKFVRSVTDGEADSNLEGLTEW